MNWAIGGLLLAIGAGYAVVPAGRRAALGVFAEMRRMYVVQPLRLITGRRRPDYARIRSLEIELRAGQASDRTG